ncbi:MAG TPA: signal peptidase I [Thermoguttaceae bacterium]|nr:signal peptidase I [Thermoguttaceae bacterium]
MSESAAPSTVAGPAAGRRPVRWLLRQLERLLAILGLATLVYFVGLDYSRITSKSMHPTLQGEDWAGGDRVMTEKFSYWFRSPRRWEVITYRAADGTQIMKRVVGLPGESVRMVRGGRIFIDGREIAPPEQLDFLAYFPFGNLTSDKPPAECGEGYFVLGDYSRDSDDSRFNGPVMPEQVIGRAWLIVGPSGRRGFVNR